MDQLSQAVSDMERVIQKNASISEASADAAEDMNSRAEQMNQITRELVAIVRGKGKVEREKDIIVGKMVDSGVDSGSLRGCRHYEENH
jgi:methyl-accepting chemotaxis protein